MKRVTLLALALASFQALGQVSLPEKRLACQKVDKIVPTDSGKGISPTSCLRRFTFAIGQRSPTMKQIVMKGQSLVRNSSVVCHVNIRGDIMLDISPEKPKCEIH